jgi:predicted ArsR family transcriptional regulator
VLLQKAKETEMKTKARTATGTRAATTKGRKAPETKKAQLIRMLSEKTGADVEAISKILTWQPHTTRAAITGLKKAGYEVVVEKSEPDRPTRYRITGRPMAEDVAAASEATNAG